MTLSIAGTVALALVALHLAATLAVNFGPWRSRFSLADMLGLLPRWRFFTHQRGTVDIAILCRPDEAGAWTPLWAFRPRGSWAWLWRPGLAADGVLWLAACTLAQRHAAGKFADGDCSAAYATILGHVRREAPFREGQFALVESAPGRDRDLLFTSPIHRW